MYWSRPRQQAVRPWGHPVHPHPISRSATRGPLWPPHASLSAWWYGGGLAMRSIITQTMGVCRWPNDAMPSLGHAPIDGHDPALVPRSGIDLASAVTLSR